MVFDLKDKNNKPIIDYMAIRTGLVVASTTMNRATFKRILSQLGMPNSSINMAATFVEAMKIVETTKPNLIIADFKIGESDAIPLLQKHKEIKGNRLDALFMVVAENNSPAMSCKIADEEAEGLAVKPYTMDTLEKELLRVLGDRITPTNYQKITEEGYAFIRAKQYSKAIEVLGMAIEEANKKKIKPTRGFYLKGIAELESGDNEKALTSLETALMSDNKSYKTLVTLIDLHIKRRDFKAAYEIVETLIKNYPPNPERIPDFIKICIANEKFDSLMQICEFFVNLEEKITTLEHPIAAGLALSAKYLIDRTNPKKALQILEKAAELGKTNPKIMASVLKSMTAAGDPKRADRIMEDILKPDSPTELHVAALQIKESFCSSTDVLRFASELLRKGIKDYEVFAIAVKSSVASQRKRSVIEEMINEGGNMYPDKKEKLIALLGNYQN